MQSRIGAERRAVHGALNIEGPACGRQAGRLGRGSLQGKLPAASRQLFQGTAEGGVFSALASKPPGFRRKSVLSQPMAAGAPAALLRKAPVCRAMAAIVVAKGRPEKTR